ncbi:DUF4286 family protein [Myxococcaceae bacterium JPH2]|nr:DUF4286 family protein [Myxococcaceae bacterium JPH2]
MRPALYTIIAEVAPGVETAWNQWQEEVHAQQVLREPGFVSCRKWRDAEPTRDGWTRYVCHYELTGLEAMENYLGSDTARQLRMDSELRFGAMMRISRQMLTEVKRLG